MPTSNGPVDIDSCCWNFGFRSDFVYGTDAQKMQAFGQPTGWDTGWDRGVYGWALPQAYVEAARNGLSIKAGHFYTLVGYEVIPSTGNFFYSHAFTMFNSEPFTHTGAIASYELGDRTTVYGGWTAGWDTGFESFDGGNSFLGGFSYSLADNAKFAYISTLGDLGWRGNNGYSHSLVLDMTLTERLSYVAQSDLLLVETDNVGTTDVIERQDIGINQYVFYAINDCLKLGGRFEWWQNDGVDYGEITGGVNIMPHANLRLRPEVRYNMSEDPVYDKLTVFAIDAIATF